MARIVWQFFALDDFAAVGRASSFEAPHSSDDAGDSLPIVDVLTVLGLRRRE
jgi:hypothetical protein